MRLFLTGASGFVGAATLGALLQAGHEVAATVRPGNPAERLKPFEGRYRRLSLDLRDSSGVTAAMGEFRPDVVLHLAWWGWRIRSGSTVARLPTILRRRARSPRRRSCPARALSSALAARAKYGAAAEMSDAAPPSSSLYGAAKVAALFLTRQPAEQAGLRHAWLRLFSTYGPRDNEGWLIPTAIIEMLSGRRPQTTLGTQKWDWLFVDDAARAIAAVAATPTAAGVFNLGSGRAVAVRSVIEQIRDLAAPGMELVFGEIPFRPDQVMHMQADISRLTAATGWAPQVSIEEGLAATIQWYRERAR